VTEYLKIEDALQVVARYGFHIRDIGLLASALTRPSTTVLGVEAYPKLAMKAAALMESVARFHPLIDGDKRTAWMLMVLMLWINGCRCSGGAGMCRLVVCFILSADTGCAWPGRFLGEASSRRHPQVTLRRHNEVGELVGKVERSDHDGH
jgi:death-on-curing protein